MTSQSCKLANLLPRFICFALLGLAAPSLVFAASLEWSNETQQFETGFEDEAVEATYAFTNVGDSTVTIVESSASCGCTVPSLTKKTYEPGESGELNAIFTIGSRQGKQRKFITVIAEDANGTQNTYELKLEVDIPIPVSFNPRVRFWKLSEEAVTQEIEVTFHEEASMVLTGLKRKDDDQGGQFDYEIETVAEGLEYIIKLTPKTPNVKSRDTFLLVSEQGNDEILRRYPIYAYVR
ncbi:DUF1573 domain-containing protein [Pelagicoccus sp. SDUM812002]|uniref:DUF1573 domain-containing protein n=1 Tax=Pelagicoccus sp. SDUM812002 TaxID=3041266 RepID=UPI00280DACCB|nr:DUF1573 domain-containing protein [Pelagicoccus sp. SDUM812002]MDQ8186392.1 DUF1573 domain-containing protein [Pelagicoccus sp. SDUM812002]